MAQKINFEVGKMYVDYFGTIVKLIDIGAGDAPLVMETVCCRNPKGRGGSTAGAKFRHAPDGSFCNDHGEGFAIKEEYTGPVPPLPESQYLKKALELAISSVTGPEGAEETAEMCISLLQGTHEITLKEKVIS